MKPIWYRCTSEFLDPGYILNDHPFFQGSESTSPYISMAWQTPRLQRLTRGNHFFRLVSSQQLRSASTLLTENIGRLFLIQKYSNLFIFFLVKTKATHFCNIMHVWDVCVSFRTKWNSYAENSPHPGWWIMGSKSSQSWWFCSTLESMDAWGRWRFCTSHASIAIGEMWVFTPMKFCIGGLTKLKY